MNEVIQNESINHIWNSPDNPVCNCSIHYGCNNYLEDLEGSVERGE